jgi:uncharacterized membrane protein
MSASSDTTQNLPTPSGHHPFRRAVLRGLGVVLPPLLTIILFLWGWNLISRYVLEPVETGAVWLIVSATADIRSEEPSSLEVGNYHQLDTGQWIPNKVYNDVKADPGKDDLRTARDYYNRFVRIHWLPRTRVIPLFLSVFVLTLYVLGRFLAAGMGRWIWASCEALIYRLPIIRNVYSSVKQVTDFVFSEQQIEFNRVVAVEYPRKGIWSVGFVTGESMLDIRSAANEPILSVLMPTSPMPATGFTVTCRKSETIDLDLTIDQAIQFVVSCGVVVPLHQQYKDEVAGKVSAAIAARESSRRIGDSGVAGPPSPNGDEGRRKDGEGQRHDPQKVERA